MSDENQTNEGLERSETDRKDRRHNKLWFTELLMVSGTILVFVGFLMVLINFYFPSGTGLFGDEGFSANSTDNTSIGDLKLDAGGFEEIELLAGEIVGVSRKVQRRTKDSLTWSTAYVGEKLEQKDAVQTFARSTAVVRINEDSQLRIGEKSLVVFEQNTHDVFLADKGSLIVMVDGELSGKISTADKGRFRFGVNLPNGVVTLRPDNATGEVEFRMTINEDQSSTVNIYGGNAHILSSDGKAVRVSANQAITIATDGSGFELFSLPTTPTAWGPANGASVIYGNLPQNIRFRWAEVHAADAYRLVISRDSEFADLVVDDNVLDAFFEHGNLSEGTYYWTVRSRKGWTQGPASDVRRLRVLRDIEEPRLVVEPPPRVVTGKEWRLRGQTEPGAEVFVDGKPAPVMSGKFDYVISLVAGANIIVVESIDSVGNIAYASYMVNARVN